MREFEHMEQILTLADNGIPVTTVKTSKKWVLPPRPKPGRKPTNERSETGKDKRRKPKTSQTIAVLGSPSPAPEILATAVAKASKQTTQQQAKIATQIKPPKQPVITTKNEVHDLNKSITVVDRENCQLKAHLLSLIHDYKHLKQMVLNKPQTLPHHLAFEDTTTTRKRSFTELVDVDPMNELICNMNDLSHCTAAAEINVEPSSPIDDTDSEIEEVLNYINLDNEDYDDEDEDEDIQSLVISRTTSPSALSETDGDNSLMTSLTRSTTVSTNNSSVVPDKKFLNSNQFKFYNLPEFTTTDYEFSFDKINPNDKMMSIIHEDKYNMVTDFLEEKLIDNDLNYYVQNESFKQ